MYTRYTHLINNNFIDVLDKIVNYLEHFTVSIESTEFS